MALAVPPRAGDPRAVEQRGPLPSGTYTSTSPSAENTGATSTDDPSRYWVSTVAAPGSSGNSSTIGRIAGSPSVCASRPTADRYGISESLSSVNRWVTVTDSSS